MTPVDVSDVHSVAAACTGAACVVSALNGLRDVIVDRQGILLDGAVQAGVPRFIPSDYAADFTKTVPGDNRNFDLRREFMVRADRASIAVTSVLNGAFMDMLGAEMPIIQPGIHRVIVWGDANWGSTSPPRTTWLPTPRPSRWMPPRRASCASPAKAQRTPAR